MVAAAGTALERVMALLDVEDRAEVAGAMALEVGVRAVEV